MIDTSGIKPQSETCIKISEIFAAPRDFDSNNDGQVNNGDEYIEIYNCGTTHLDLAGFVLDDIINGGSSPYTINPNTLIDPGGYLVFYQNLTKINLNNSNESVNLIGPNGNIIDSFSYSSSSYDISIAYLHTWDIMISDIPTPGESTTSPTNTSIAQLSDQLSTINALVTDTDTMYKGFALLQDESSVIRIRTEAIPENSLGKSFQLLGYLKARSNYNEFTVISFKPIDINFDFPSVEIPDLSTEYLDTTLCLNGYVSQIKEDSIQLVHLEDETYFVTVHLPTTHSLLKSQILTACGILDYKYSKYHLHVTDPSLITTQTQSSLGLLANTGINFYPVWIILLVIVFGISQVLNYKRKI